MSNSTAETVVIREEATNLILDRLQTMDDSIKAIARKQKEHDRLFSVMDDNFNILEDAIVIIRSVEQLLKTQRDRQNTTSKELAAGINEVKEITENISDEVEETISENLNKLIKVVERKKAIVMGPNLFARIFRRGK